MLSRHFKGEICLNAFTFEQFQKLKEFAPKPENKVFLLQTQHPCIFGLIPDPNQDFRRAGKIKKN